MLRCILLMSLAIGLCQTALAGVVRIADGDCTGLANAVTTATYTQSKTSILLTRSGNYSACSVSASSGSMEIDGQGAVLQLFSAQVASTAALTIRNATLTGGNSGDKLKSACALDYVDVGLIQATTNAICNSGTLMLDSVTFRDWPSSLSCLRTDGIGGLCDVQSLLWSSGALILRNVTAANFSLTPLYATPGSFITNSGALEIYNSTIANAAAKMPIVASNAALPPPSPPVPPAPTLKIANSLFTGSSNSPLCLLTAGSTQSLGGNVATDSSCGFATASGDKIVAGLSLLGASDQGGLVQTVPIAYGNPAYRAGVAQYCEATDARAVTRNATNCDAGAYESGGGLGLVTSNGMNGFYYVPGIANGHYVSVQRIHDNNDVMVFWNTFDNNGNQAWIYGIGTLTSARHIHAQMARNTGGVLQPGGAPTGAKASEWGTVDIDLTSCSAAQFSYQSSLPEFGSGQFPLTRLAFESAINCGD